MDKDLGYWETVFDVEGLVDAGDVDQLVAALRSDVIYTLKQAIADWELEVQKRDDAGKC
jgi:hypothetical protein